MFNRTTHHHETKVVAVTKEIEKSITPDRVTDMYDKVRSEVEKTIVRSILVQNNVLQGIVIETFDDYLTRSRHIHLRFTLNGKEYMDKQQLPERMELTDDNLVRRLYNFYLSILTEQLLKADPIFKTKTYQ